MPSSRGPTILLLVDDDVDIRESFQEVLELEGYPVVTADNGRSALEALQHTDPAVILVDLMMPVMDGAQFLKALRADPARRTFPVIMVTAFADRAADLPADAIVEKPLGPPVLLEVIRAQLARSSR